MTAHFGWFGTRGVDTNLPTESPVNDSQVGLFMRTPEPVDPYRERTFDIYMSYGVDGYDIPSYKTFVIEVLGLLDTEGKPPKLLLKLPIFALDNAALPSPNTSDIEDIETE